ncbi:hypothetical protein NDU88_008317 [Pleurodeles waltl]|uniref:Secreted protein n=1 Tax=Pleurodeles waltl TaxID=8319 RepID=A0AAV7PNT4_PLEWA|nr:hypothetical protein NDU88_008317 [Pleurodeles waltl]
MGLKGLARSVRQSRSTSIVVRAFIYFLVYFPWQPNDRERQQTGDKGWRPNPLGSAAERAASHGERQRSSKAQWGAVFSGRLQRVCGNVLAPPHYTPPLLGAHFLPPGAYHTQTT